MKRLGRISSVCVVACVLAPIVTRNGTAEDETIRLSGRVLGSSGKSVIYGALWQADGFLKRPVRQVRIEPVEPTGFPVREVPGGPRVA